MSKKKDHRRERFLEWLRAGDPARVPIRIGDPALTAATYFDVPVERVTPEQARRATKEMHMQGMIYAGSPSTFEAIPFCDDLSLDHHDETLPDGTKRRTSHLKTPAGTLREVYDEPPGLPGHKREFFVKGEEDLPVLESYIRLAVETVLTNPAVREAHLAGLKERIRTWSDAFPTVTHVFCPTVEFMCAHYMDQATAIYTVYDRQDLLEELYDLHWKLTEVFLECARQADVDIYNYAINGLEWLSLDLYERYLIPQARRINDYAHSLGKLSWLHTCGKKKKLIEQKAYERMHVDVLETMTSPPTGDLDDFRAARIALGERITTQGGINFELFFGDLEPLRRRTHEVLDGAAGFRHIIGDTDAGPPARSKEILQVVVDAVRERGSLFD